LIEDVAPEWTEEGVTAEELELALRSGIDAMDEANGRRVDPAVFSARRRSRNSHVNRLKDFWWRVMASFRPIAHYTFIFAIFTAIFLTLFKNLLW
jgi:hypothetical protein